MATKNLTYLEGSTLFVTVSMTAIGNFPLVVWAEFKKDGSTVALFNQSNYVYVEGNFIKLIVPPDVMDQYLDKGEIYDYSIYYKFWEEGRVLAQSGTLSYSGQLELAVDQPTVSENAELANGIVVRYSLVPIDAVDNYLGDALALADGETTEYTEIPYVPDYPRIATVKGSVAGIAGDVVVVGTNILDQEITDTIVADGDSLVLGTKAFKEVTSITVPAWNAEGDTISVGIGNKFGLPHIVYSPACLLVKQLGGSDDAGTLSVDNNEIEKNLYAVAGSPDGDSVLDLLYVVE